MATPTKSKSKQKKKGTTARAHIKVAPFRVTVQKIGAKAGEGFSMQFDGVQGNRLTAISITLEFPKWWANHLVNKLDGAKE